MPISEQKMPQINREMMKKKNINFWRLMLAQQVNFQI
jgi:hypothetical protein